MLVHPCSSECSICLLSLLCTNYSEWKRATINKNQMGKCHPVNPTLYPSNSQETFYFWVTMASAAAHFICWEFLQQREFLHYMFPWHFLTPIFFFFPYESVCVAYTHTSLEKQANSTDFSTQKISSLQVPVHDSCCSCYMHHEHSIRERNNRITSLSSAQNSQGDR